MLTTRYASSPTMLCCAVLCLASTDLEIEPCIGVGVLGRSRLNFELELRRPSYARLVDGISPIANGGSDFGAAGCGGRQGCQGGVIAHVAGSEAEPLNPPRSEVPLWCILLKGKCY